MFTNAGRMVQSEPGAIIGPISNVLGFILDFIFGLFYHLAPSVAFGLSVIVFTIIIRTLILPLAIKMHKSMLAMRRIQPEMQKINDKYGNTKDPEKMRQKQMEMQALYSKNKANPLGGCLPALIQMPILLTLFNMFQRPHLYMTGLGDAYRQIAAHVMTVPNYAQYILDNFVLWGHRVPVGMDLDHRTQEGLVRLFSVYDDYDWANLFDLMPGLDVAYVTGVIDHINVLEHFATISLVSPASFTSVSLIIAILAVITTFTSSKIMMKNQAATAPEGSTMQQQQQIMQKMMLYGIPVMMGFMAFTVPVAVSLYWIVGNIYQLCQHTILNKTIRF